MAIPSFFKQNKPRGFNYIPRYYDPVKEELEQRRREWEKERGKQDEGKNTPGEGLSSSEASEGAESSSAEAPENRARQPYRTKIMRGDMKNYFPRRQERVRKQNTIRLLVILIIIALIVYIYLRF